MFCERNRPLERENVYQFVKKKLEGPGTIISRDKIKRKWLETTERDLFHQGKTDVKSTVVARIGCTPYTTPAYGQTCVRTLPYEYAAVNSTTGNWAHLTSKHPQSPQKMGKVIMVGSRRVFVLFLILGRRADHPMIFHIFSISFLP